ncbi:MAG: exopolyphosphatase, partial [Propionibacteriaceae bacterium]|nr:exopolyphosphatase [Propionibacteriaceae bacterium]
RIARATSLNMGSVRVRERFFTSDPPSADDLAAAVRFIDEQLDTVDLTDVRAWVGVAGTCTSMGALLLGLDAYDRELVEGLVMPREAIEAVVAGLCTTPSAELVSPLLPPLRAEVIGAGALICARIAGRVEAHMVVSEHDILDAVAQRLLA